MSVPSMTLWDDPEYASGSSLLHVVTGVLGQDGNFVRDVKGEHTLSLAAGKDEPWVAAAVPGTVLRYDRNGTVTEWWVASREDALDRPDVVRFEFDPLHTLLADVGPMEGTVSPFIGRTDLGLAVGTAGNYISTFVLPWLTAKGISYVTLGTMASSESFSLRWDSWTPLQLLVELADRLELEWALERNDGDSDYQIDLVAEVGSAGTTAWVAEGLNLTSLRRTQDRESLWTVLRPIGLLASGDVRRADISQNSWRVTAVASDVITVEAHNGGDHPIAEDDQWIGNYLEDATGTLREIVDSDASAGTITVDTGLGTNFAVGDDVSIVRNSSGDPLTEVESPSGVASYGRIAGPMEVNIRGERNWIRNPLFSDWTSTPVGESCLKDGTQSGTSYDLKGLPVGMVISAGDLLMDPFALSSSFTRITTGDTVDGSGLATVVVAATMGSITDNDYLLVLSQVGEPDDWDRAQASNSSLVLLQTPRAAARSISCDVDGNQTFGISDEHELNLKNLGASTVVPEGALITYSGLARGWITKGGTANGSGDLTVSFFFQSTWNPSDNDALVLETPDLSGWAGTDAPGALRMYGTAVYLDLDFSVRYLADRPTLYLTAHCRAMAPGAVAANGWASGDATKAPPSLQLITTPSTVVASDEAADWTPAAVAEDHSFTLQCSYTMTATDEFRARIVWPLQSSGTAGAGPWMWVEALEAHLGPQQTVPVVEGSYASEIIQKANAMLQDRNIWASQYEVGLIELAESLNVDPAVVRAAEGAKVRLRSDRLSIDEELRIIRLVGNPTREEDVRVVLKRRPYLLSRTVRAQPETLYANIVVDEGGANEEEITVVPTPNPPEVVGAPTASASLSEQSSNSALTLKAAT